MSDLASLTNSGPKQQRIARPERPERRQARAGMVLFAPALVLLILILIVPVGVAALLSFTDYTLGRPSIDWVGLRNYIDIFTGSSYRKMIVATVLYVALVVPASVFLGLGAALLIRLTSQITILRGNNLGAEVCDDFAFMVAVSALTEMNHDLLLYDVAFAGLQAHQVEPCVRGERVDQSWHAHDIAYLLRRHARAELINHLFGDEVALRNINAIDTRKAHGTAGSAQCGQGQDRNQQQFAHSSVDFIQVEAIIQTLSGDTSSPVGRPAA